MHSFGKRLLQLGFQNFELGFGVWISGGGMEAEARNAAAQDCRVSSMQSHFQVFF